MWNNRKELIHKIFDIFASKEQIELSNQFPDFICLKTEFVLHFFYEKLKKMKNVKLFVSLRLLFISTMAKFS